MVANLSRLFGQPDKNTGDKLEIRSHRYLVKAGYISESVAGRYYFLPLGWRLHQKLTDLIRSEMDAAGAQEIVAPILHPLKLWRETNRDRAVGFELMQLKDRRGGQFALGGTAEEMFVDLVRQYNLSYRQLPLNLYQFGWKFRDELRARGGLLRLREFVMKDAYSFSTEAQFEQVYDQMKQTYSRIFQRLGLPIEIVAADNGYIGGDYCHEFLVPSAVGESRYLVDENNQAVHEDLARFQRQPPTDQTEPQPLQMVDCPRGPTMADSRAAHSGSQLIDHIKNVAYIDDRQRLVLACLSGDLTVNTNKLARLVEAATLTILSGQQVRDYLNSEPGFLSAVNLKPAAGYELIVVADLSLADRTNLISGANQPNKDYVNINLGRDFKADQMADIGLAEDGAVSLTGGRLSQRQGIEVANIFQLGYYYSQRMAKASYSDSQGQQQPYYMGCYGIGLARTLAAIAEMTSDDYGLAWPVNLSPYDLLLVPLQPDLLPQAGRLATELSEAGYELVCDDRPQIQPGQKLATADLIGLPLIVIISHKTLQTDQVEVQIRASRQRQLIKRQQLTAYLADFFRSGKKPNSVK